MFYTFDGGKTSRPAFLPWWWPSESSSCNKQRSLLLKSIISKRFSVLLLRLEWSHCDPFGEERTAGGSPCPGYELFGKQSSILSFLRFFVSCKNQGIKFRAGNPSSLHRGVEKKILFSFYDRIASLSLYIFLFILTYFRCFFHKAYLKFSDGGDFRPHVVMTTACRRETLAELNIF